MSAMQLVIVVLLLTAISYWLQKLNCTLEDIAEELGKRENTLMKENEELKKALKGGE